MKLRVEYMAQVKTAAAVGSETVTLKDNAGLVELVRLLAGCHGPGFGAMVLDATGGIAPSIIITVNNEQAYPSDCPLLADGDTVMIMTPMSGG
jgi:molybdopterin converting factor small subunit